MSAFVVSKKIIDKVVRAWPLPEGVMSMPCAWYDDIGRKLWDMNVDAVRQRYGKDDSWAHGEYKYSGSSYSQAESYKAACSLHYQCSEGDVPKRPLYKTLEKLCNSLAHSLAMDRPDVQAACWDG